jgi:hypothetical protein
VNQDPKGVAELQRAEVSRILLERNISNEDLDKIVALSNLIGGPDGDDAIVETMYAYLTGKANWQEDYKEFFS